ncbi:hypothetical protein CHK_3206 [Christensenella hongkongensis]|uniref:Uncharacterized protein n=1 Tax=Christensenella hongkongensis TaxID=270498 RepID=A0A0M2NA35_9FIRM|nr:hypothetical protein CHK_3206 [Christensenella hongkongensis]
MKQRKAYLPKRRFLRSMPPVFDKILTKKNAIMTVCTVVCGQGITIEV